MIASLLTFLAAYIAFGHVVLSFPFENEERQAALCSHFVNTTCPIANKDPPPVPQYNCGNQGSLTSPIPLADLIICETNTLEACRDTCFSYTQCRSFGYSAVTGQCTLYSQDLKTSNPTWTTTPTPRTPTFYDRECFASTCASTQQPATSQEEPTEVFVIQNPSFEAVDARLIPERNRTHHFPTSWNYTKSSTAHAYFVNTEGTDGATCFRLAGYWFPVIMVPGMDYTYFITQQVSGLEVGALYRLTVDMAGFTGEGETPVEGRDATVRFTLDDEQPGTVNLCSAEGCYDDRAEAHWKLAQEYWFTPTGETQTLKIEFLTKGLNWFYLDNIHTYRMPVGSSVGSGTATGSFG